MPIITTAGTKVSIGTTTVMTTAALYSNDTWTPIGNIEDLGDAGSEAEIVTGKYVDQTYVRKFKGSRDNGNVELVVARDVTDPGYTALVAAEGSSLGYNFKIELPDKPSTGASPANSILYFNAIVASRKNTFGGADNIVNTTFVLAITGPIIERIASGVTAP